MALRKRIGSTCLRSISYLRHRNLPVAGAISPAAEPPVLSGSVGPAAPQPPRAAKLFQVRCFAAPAQAKTKPKAAAAADDSTGPRKNREITAPYLRLVTEEGHGVVSRKEALELAMRLNLDLVEVQGTADPPVCKIMDFHKEKYKKELKQKERLKTKSALSLRSGEKKEVRFKAKTEIKDIKVKADQITRLMERGYRVKCTAMPSGSGGEDLGGLLSRLLDLIEDVSVVESGPHVDSKHAYVIVRHVKFETKKSGKKVNKAMENVNRRIPNAVSETPLQDEEWEEAECDSEADNGTISDRVEENPMHLSRETSAQREAQNRGSGKEQYPGSLCNFDMEGSRISHSGADKTTSQSMLQDLSGLHELRTSVPGAGSTTTKPAIGKGDRNQEPAAVEMNRYAARSGHMGRYQQTRGDSSQSPSRGWFPQDPRRNENEGRFSLNNNQRPFQPYHRPSPPSGDGKFTAQRNPGLSNQGRSEPPRVGNTADSVSSNNSYGIFSAPNSASSQPKDMRDTGTSKPASPDFPKSYGVFSSSRTTPSHDDNISKGGPANISSPVPKFGIFNSAKHTGSSDQSNSIGSNSGTPGNTSPPAPKFGIFQTKRTTPSNQN